MGNGFSSVSSFFRRSRTAEGSGSIVEPWLCEDETEGHSFRYLPSSSPSTRSSSAGSSPSRGLVRHDSVLPSLVKDITGAAVSGNSSRRIRSLSQALWDESADSPAPSNIPCFEGSRSFAAVPLRLSSPEETAFSSAPIDLAVSRPATIDHGDLSDNSSRRGLSISSAVIKIDKKKEKEGFNIARGHPLLRRASLFLRPVSSERILSSLSPVRSGGESPLQWAHARAGEDRVHVVVSEEHRWLFVGIYDGFNGSEASEFLAENLYREVVNQLERLYGENPQESQDLEKAMEEEGGSGSRRESSLQQSSKVDRSVLQSVSNSFLSRSRIFSNRIRSWSKKRGETSSQKRGKTWKPHLAVDHGLVLEALSRALEITEVKYLEMMNMEISRKPELALSGSCVLVILMRDEDVYVMNVGDSRAIIGQLQLGESSSDVFSLDEDIVEETTSQLVALQLSTDHNTSIEDEVRRIREEHKDDNKCIMNSKVKGRLRVTRAFGAAFLKKREWNEGLLGVLRAEYIGTAPYISSSPSLRHRRLCRSDQFLVISSDGLYQCMTNEEVASYVKVFAEKFPDGDPASGLIEESLHRAADKAGMEFDELLAVPPGDRRRYHDDVTAVVVSLQGRRMWESTGSL